MILEALNISVTALANPGDNILLPSPGFPLYQTICSARGMESIWCDLNCIQLVTALLGLEPLFYHLLPDKEWECDLVQMESLINEKTVTGGWLLACYSCQQSK